jgi:hypothetical protein
MCNTGLAAACCPVPAWLLSLLLLLLLLSDAAVAAERHLCWLLVAARRRKLGETGRLWSCLGSAAVAAAGAESEGCLALLLWQVQQHFKL